MGGTVGEVFKQNRYYVLNKTNENFNDREVNLRLVQLVESYQASSLRGKVCCGCGKIYKSDDKIKTLLELGIDLGIDFVAGKVIDKAIDKFVDKPLKKFLTK